MGGPRRAMTTATDFEVTHEAATDAAGVVVVRGELDLSTAPVVRRRITQVIEGGAREIVVDLTESTFLDSSGLGVLVGAVKRLRPLGGRILVVATAARLMRTLAITGLDQVLEVYPTREAAVAELDALA